MNSGEPLSTRAARMKVYNELVRQLDASGGHYSRDLSEVDLSDLEDVKVITNDPEGEVLVHLGSSNYLDRFKIYVAHLREWRQQFAQVESVDLRYERQIIVNPDLRGTERQAPLSAAAARAAISAGVKPTALVIRAPAKASAPKTALVKSAVGKRSQRPVRWHKHRTPLKYLATKPVAHAVSSASKSPPVPAAQKPSPAIPKGPGKR